MRREICLAEKKTRNLTSLRPRPNGLRPETPSYSPPRDTGFAGKNSKTAPEAAQTDGVTCRSEIPKRNLTRYCDAIIEHMWEHERVHRERCKARTTAGRTDYDYHGSVHANEEAAAYEAGNAILRTEIERVLEESELRVRATVTPSVALGTAAARSHQDSTFDITLKPQGASADGVVEFRDLTGKSQTRFTKLQHEDCSAKPVNQALALSVRTVDMQNFTVIHQPGKPQTTRYTCRRPGGDYNQPLLSMFANRWVQPIRAQRPFPYSALVILGGSSDGGFPGALGVLPPNMRALLGFIVRDGGVTPGIGPMSPDGGQPPGALSQFPNLTPAETPFLSMDTMMTLSCP